MTDIVVEVTSTEGGTLHTAGKYCDRDIAVVPKLQDKTATGNGPVTPDEGYAGLKQVTVSVPASGVDTSNDTVTAEKMLDGVTAHDASGKPITGSIPTLKVQNPFVIPSTTADARTIRSAGKYVDSDITIIPSLQPKVVTENGEFLPNDGFIGFWKVSVNVQPTANDTVTADAMLKGTTAHDASGTQITGTISTYSGAAQGGIVKLS